VFILERLPKVEGKGFLLRQARSTTSHAPFRAISDGVAIREALLGYFLDDGSYIDEDEPLISANLSWSSILEAAREPDKEHSLEFHESMLVLVIDLDVVRDRAIYDGHSFAADAIKAGLVDHYNAVRMGHFENMVIIHPGRLDITLGEVAVVHIGEGDATHRLWKGMELL
jgi:hypothetical protein